jgi:F0F1-type ATP synthase gamma subunit
MVPVTSDKGLCGGVNSNVVREVKSTVNPQRSLYKLFCVGDKGTVGLIRPFPDLIVGAIS